MNNMDYPDHWVFALAAAFGYLEKLVWEFDSLNVKVDERGNAAYTGVPTPKELIAIIDGFLGEKEKLYLGDVARLEQMRAYLETNLVTSYQMGSERAVQLWENASSEERKTFAGLDFPEFREEARKNAPGSFSSTERGWFVEGFSRAWREIWMTYYRESLGM